MLHALVFGPQEKAHIQKVIAYASDPANVYNPFKPGEKKAPGDDLNYVVILGLQKTLRVVFSLTRCAPDSQMLYRHMSVSSKFGGCPNPILVYAIAKAFGFTGPEMWPGALPKTWAVALDEDQKCAIVAEPITARDDDGSERQPS